MYTITYLMDYLHGKLPFCRSDLFYRIFSAGLLLQPFAIWAQAIKAWRVDSLEGLSLPTFLAFAFLQTIGMLYGIRIREPAIFAAMGVSFLASCTILLAFLIQ